MSSTGRWRSRPSLQLYKPARLLASLAADTSLQPEQAMRKRIWEQRESMGGINASRENTAAIAKQIAILENRLAR